MSTDTVSEHLHSQVSAQDARIGGIEARLSNVETAVTDGFATLNTKLDSSTRPQTFAVLSTIGGAVSLVLMGFGIVLSLTVSPLRESDAATAAVLDKKTDITLRLLEELSETKQRTISAESLISAHGYDIRANEDDISDLRSDVSHLKANDITTRHWLERVDDLGSRTIHNANKHASHE